MSSTPSSKSSVSGGGRGGANKSKTPRVLVLKLPASQLTQFPHAAPTPSKSAAASKSPSPSSTPAAASKESPSSPTEMKEEVKAEPPTEASATLKAPEDGRKKGLGGPKAGLKRSASVLNDGQPKPRAKPGPKKRKLDGLNGDEASRPWTTPAPAATHKLGPKANQGAINAGLRALDRSGKPCRKWQKTGFVLKSFTGVTWSLPSWGATKKPNDAKEPGQSDTTNSNSDIQRVPSSSNVGSETSRNNAVEPNGTTDSPAAVVEATA